MDKLRPHLRSARAALTVAWRRATRRVPRAGRLGIAARLSIAFGAVAILTVAANQIAERGSTLIRTMAQATVVAPGLDNLTAEALPAALDQFQRALLARADSAAAPRAQAQVEAVAALDAARAELSGGPAADDRRSHYFSASRPKLRDMPSLAPTSCALPTQDGAS